MSDPGSAEPAMATTKADEIARSIEELIVACRLEPGQVLRQDEISRRFGVSRTPVREAFRQLAALGLVSFVPNRGVRVRALDQDEWGQAFLARAALEGSAAHLAAARWGHADIERIDTASAEFRRQTDLLRSPGLPGGERDRASFAQNAADDAFHDAVLCAARIPFVERLIVGLRRVFSGATMWAPDSSVDRLYEATLRQHDAIQYALASGNGEAARRLAHDHVLDSWELLRAVITEAREFVPIEKFDAAGPAASSACSEPNAYRIRAIDNRGADE